MTIDEDQSRTGFAFFCPFFVLVKGRMVVVTRAFRTLILQVSVLQYTELAGYESELYFLFSSELFSSVIFSFLLFGVQGVEPSCKLCIGAFNLPKL